MVCVVCLNTPGVFTIHPVFLRYTLYFFYLALCPVDSVDCLEHKQARSYVEASGGSCLLVPHRRG